ncbi:Homeobox protein LUMINIDEPENDENS-like protein [Drosera capensis]
MAMAVSKQRQHHHSSELVIFSSGDSSFHDVLESQKALFHGQIDQLREIVVTQCKLTGVNPLSHEMAAGAFSVTIGKRPRDMLNPKFVKHTQSVFSIKDVMSKKETREISALYGLTVTQVREYFGDQRSRLRKLSRLSKEKANKTMVINEPQDGFPANADSVMPINLVPLSSIAPSSAEETTSTSTQEEVLPGISESDKHFVDNVFDKIRQEETFGGEIKLMEWILQIENPVVLCWFLTKGGLMILASWLSDATTEEQTNVLDAILKVLSHLPLHKALPSHMAAILQAVNRLRFYRSSDISNRARVLLSRLSKIFAKMQGGKDPTHPKSVSNARKDILADAGGAAEDIRSMEPSQPLKLLTMTSDESNKKQTLGLTSIHNKGKRKVLLVEAPGQKSVAKSHHGSRAVPASHARPITADEIQKAKMRAQFMQDKHGGANGVDNRSLPKEKGKGQKRPLLLTNDLLSASEAYMRPKREIQKKAKVTVQNNVDRTETTPEGEKIAGKENMSPGYRVQVNWRTPPEIRFDPIWNVAAGENSKEVHVQKSRIMREKDPLYRTNADIPSNPKKPWDVEMDYDDTLTPMIPLEPLPDLDGPMEAQTEDHENMVTKVAPPQNGNAGGETVAAATEPDFELLAVLLKNPDLISALMSGQANGLSSEDTARLLDMIKTTGGQVPGTLNGVLGHSAAAALSPTPPRNISVSIPSRTDPQPSRPEVSLPSPTPSSDPVPGRLWRSEATTGAGPSNSSLHNQRLTISDPIPQYPNLSQPSIVVHDTRPVACHTVSPALNRNPSPINHPSVFQNQTTAPIREFPHATSTPQPLLPRESLQQHSYLQPHHYPPPQPAFHEPHLLPSSYGSAHQHWRTRQGLAPDPYHYQTNQFDNVGTSARGPRERSPLPGPSWHRTGTGYGSWSPEQGPMHGSGRGRGWGRGPPDRSGDRQGDASNGWWRDYERR